MMGKHKAKRTALVSAALLLLLAGCGGNNGGNNGGDSAAAADNGAGKAASGEKAKISFWAAAVTTERNAFFEEIVKQFEQENPDIDVDYLGVPGDLAAYEQKVNVAISADQAPDVMNDFKSDLLARGCWSRWTPIMSSGRTRTCSTRN